MGVLLAREASRAGHTDQGCAGGVRRNASEGRVHFLAAMRNKALEPLWQKTSVLFRVTTHNACSRNALPPHSSCCAEPTQNYRRIMRFHTEVCLLAAGGGCVGFGCVCCSAPWNEQFRSSRCTRMAS